MLVLGALMIASCTHGSSLRARSAGDMHCASESLNIYRLDKRSYRVVGCGQEFVYVSTCEDTDITRKDDCTWVLNSHRGDSDAKEGAERPASGCSFDGQCKGDRICVHHECKEPRAAPASSSPN